MSKFLEARLHKRHKVLVVDDEAVNRMMLEKILGTKFEVILAENGRQALNIILENKETLSIVDGRQVGLGTPQYAAPEQFSGGEITPFKIA